MSSRRSAGRGARAVPDRRAVLRRARAGDRPGPRGRRRGGARSRRSPSTCNELLTSGARSGGGGQGADRATCRAASAASGASNCTVDAIADAARLARRPGRHARVPREAQAGLDAAWMIRRLLIANRGEIALRIIRACRELGIETVAVYSDADARAPHVRAADVAVRIGPAPAARELSEHRARSSTRRASTGADAVHPGLRLPVRERRVRATPARTPG